MALDLREGFSVTLHSTRYRILHIQAERQVSLLNERTSSVKHLTMDEVEVYFQQGQLKVITDQDILFREDGLPPIPSALPADHRARLQRNLAYVRAVLAQTEHYSREQETLPVIAEVAKQLRDAKPPSSITIYRWCQSYINSNEDPLALAPMTANCGRRKGQIDVEVIELFYETIDTYYLYGARYSRIDAHAELCDRVVEANRQRPKEEWLRAISYSGFCKLVKRLLDPFIVMARRMGEKYARRYFRSRDRGPVALFILERIEIDHTRLDIIVVHPITRKLLGRPTVTVAIDRRSRMVVGIYIDLEPPSSIAVLMCLRQAVTNKQAILDGIPECQGFTWPVEGQFRMICMDNGPEFHSNVHKQFCADLHADMQYCPPGKPWYKGAVERFIGTLNRRLIHKLPGTTWSNPVERGDYPSEKLASLTLHELRQMVFRWVVVDYHNTRHHELGETPLQCWTRLADEHPAPPLPQSLSLEIETGLAFEKTISDGRIGTKGLLYHHPYLIHLQQKLPGKPKVMLRIDPEDVTQAYIYDPLNKALIKLECLTIDVEPGTSWLDFQRARKAQAQGTTDPTGPDAELVRQEKTKLRRDVHQTHQQAEKRLKQAQRKKKQVPRRSTKGDIQLIAPETPENHAWEEVSSPAGWSLERLPLEGDSK
ncbi:Mu transposase C-terminal domain-containing protein [Vogesella indigofera]|uniref:Mu transposase C-terminal domain-containing protein n=1 Tax=Vogesella indigofera TaxID=45465 RepID=UPI0035B110F7